MFWRNVLTFASEYIKQASNMKERTNQKKCIGDEEKWLETVGKVKGRRMEKTSKVSDSEIHIKLSCSWADSQIHILLANETNKHESQNRKVKMNKMEEMFVRDDRLIGYTIYMVHILSFLSCSSVFW